MIAETLINPADSLERQRDKLLEISDVLMRRVEQDTDRTGAAYALFERAALLEEQIRQRTRDLEHALELLNASNAQLAEANRATETARANLADALETIQDGFALFGPDEALITCNSRFGQHMGDLTAGLTPGLRFGDYLRKVSQSSNLALPQGVSPKQWLAQRMRRHREARAVFNVQLTGDRWVQVSEHRTGNGGTVIMQTEITDIIRGQRQERERMLDDQAQVVRATLDHINEGVCVFDGEARLAGWNEKAGALLSLPLSRFRIGTGFDALVELVADSITFVGDVDAAALKAWAALGRGRKPLRFEIRRAALALDVFAQEMPDGSFVISFTDVTAERDALRGLHEANEFLERRVRDRTLELEDALTAAERANASKLRFVAAASHDLLQPLSAAKLYIASVVEGGNPEPDSVVARKAGDALNSVEKIIEDLLDVSKLELGKFSVSVSSFPLNDLLRPLTDAFAPAAALKGLKFRVRPSAARVRSDPNYLRRILQNLISNAIRYTDKGGVLVGARPSGGGIRVEVWDTGPGIADEDQEAIFIEFNRLNAKASAGEGMGLGLTIVERACARLGHPLSLTSVVGRGTRFSVQLPLGNAAWSRPEDDQEDAAPLSGDGPRIVMLVENDPVLSQALTERLEKLGIEVFGATCARDALALLEEIDLLPDIFLIDQQLDNDETGIELYDRLCQRYGNVDARMISADRSAEFRAACKARGLQLLVKPLGAEALAAALGGEPTAA